MKKYISKEEEKKMGHVLAQRRRKKNALVINFLLFNWLKMGHVLAIFSNKLFPFTKKVFSNLEPIWECDFKNCVFEIATF